VRYNNVLGYEGRENSRKCKEMKIDTFVKKKM
jgi:hypothetical protein